MENINGYHRSLSLFFIFFLFTAFHASGQAILTGEMGGPCGYAAGCAMSSSLGGSHLYTNVPNSAGDVFFRFEDASFTEYRPVNDGDIIPVNSATPYTSILTGNFNAFRITGTNTSYNYVFKINSGYSAIAIFEIQGTIRSISSVSRSATTVSPGQDITVTATLDGAFSTGQAVYLRYTDDSFSTSTVVNESSVYRR